MFTLSDIEEIGNEILREDMIDAPISTLLIANDFLVALLQKLFDREVEDFLVALLQKLYEREVEQETNEPAHKIIEGNE